MDASVIGGANTTSVRNARRTHRAGQDDAHAAVIARVRTNDPIPAARILVQVRVGRRPHRFRWPVDLDPSTGLPIENASARARCTAGAGGCIVVATGRALSRHGGRVAFGCSSGRSFPLGAGNAWSSRPDQGSKPAHALRGASVGGVLTDAHDAGFQCARPASRVRRHPVNHGALMRCPNQINFNKSLTADAIEGRMRALA